MEPFECGRQQEKQRRAFRQLQSYMSLEFYGGHLLRNLSNEHDEDEYQNYLIGSQISDLTWPIRMVRQRLLARKSNHTNKNFAADLLLDMPNLTHDWSTLNKLLPNFIMYLNLSRPYIILYDIEILLGYNNFTEHLILYKKKEQNKSILKLKTAFNFYGINHVIFYLNISMYYFIFKREIVMLKYF